MFKKILVPKVGRLQNGEIIQYFNNLITIYEQNNATALQLDNTLNEFVSLYQGLPKTHKRRTKNALTADLQEADRKRVLALRGLRKSLQLSLLIDDPEVVRAAERLYTDFAAQFDNLRKMTLPNKTGTIMALLQRWGEDPGFVSAREKLSVDTWIEKLTEHNQNFDNLYIERVNTTERKPSLYEKKADVIPVFQKLMRETEARALITPEEPRYADLINRINILGDKFSKMIKSRNNDKESVSEGTDTPPQALI